MPGEYFSKILQEKDIHKKGTKLFLELVRSNEKAYDLYLENIKAWKAKDYQKGRSLRDEIIRLEREVDSEPLELSEDALYVGDELYVIGHPAGLPLKVADGARVRQIKDEHFVANLDTYGGNSGSAVFSMETDKVVGLLVRGETDFVWDSEHQCKRSNRCGNFGCSGEDVTWG